MILSIGWKNVWRNKTRSLVVIIAIILGIFGGVMATGIMQGWIEQRVHDAIYIEVSHVQIHNQQFLLNEEMQHTIVDPEKVFATLDTAVGVTAYSPRVKVFAMAQSDWAASGMVIKGVDPEKESRVSEIKNKIVEGEFLNGTYKIPSIVISSKTAEALKLLNYQVTREKLDSIDRKIYPPEIVKKLESIGDKRFRKEKDFRSALKSSLDEKEYNQFADKLVKYLSFYRMNTGIQLTIQNKNGMIQNPVFKVRGIYKTSNAMYDALNAFVDRNALNQFAGLDPKEVHEIAIIGASNESGIQLADKLTGYLPENSVMSWRKVSPEIAYYADFTAVMSYMYVGIILFALAFGIINTMLMSVLERFKELGMLMAIGMSKARVFMMIMLESVLLSLTGGLTGLAISGLIINLLGKTGIDFGMWAEGFEAVGYSSVVYPYLTVENYIIITLLVIITGLIASIWPARRALKLNPADALRTE